MSQTTKWVGALPIAKKIVILLTVFAIIALVSDFSWPVLAAEDAGTIKEKAKFTTIMDKYGLGLAILFSFWWALLANVGSACIYPMEPITISYYARQAETPG
ncbi:MAG TPA: hypothetical protein ACFYD5_08855, partial [Candidatus Tripitaka sp. YC43]